VRIGGMPARAVYPAGIPLQTYLIS
jgi:hypothetical protein